MQVSESNSDLALAHYQAGFKPLLYGIRHCADFDFFPEGNRTGDEEDMNLIFSIP